MIEVPSKNWPRKVKGLKYTLARTASILRANGLYVTLYVKLDGSFVLYSNPTVPDWQKYGIKSARYTGSSLQSVVEYYVTDLRKVYNKYRNESIK